MNSGMWNPWHGCHKYSEGCLNCYMFSFDKQRGVDSNFVHKTSDFDLPIKKDRYHNFKVQDGSHLSVCLTSDFFIEEADVWRSDVWDFIKARGNVKFSLFTKRVYRIAQCLPSDWGDSYENVEIVLTVENQKRADERLPIFLALPLKHRVLTVSPMLEKIDLSKYLKTGLIEEVYCSGENYKNSRVCDYDWVKNLSEQCKSANVKFIFFATGSKFRKDGKIYYIPYKKGKEQAIKANLNFIPKEKA